VGGVGALLSALCFRRQTWRNRRCGASAERKGENEAFFRSVNEKLEDRAQALIDPRDAHRIPFLCECPSRDCTKTVLLSLDEYEGVRGKPNRGLSALGHADLSVERVIAENDRFVTTEKFGAAAEAFAAADPRS
jgi:hypothetical protein